MKNATIPIYTENNKGIFSEIGSGAFIPELKGALDMAKASLSEKGNKSSRLISIAEFDLTHVIL